MNLYSVQEYYLLIFGKIEIGEKFKIHFFKSDKIYLLAVCLSKKTWLASPLIPVDHMSPSQAFCYNFISSATVPIDFDFKSVTVGEI